MNCDYKSLGEPPQNGREHWKCVRHGCNHTKTDIWIPLGNKIHPGKCTAIPRWWEFGGWVELLIEASGILDWFPQHPAGEISCRGCGQRVERLNALGHRLFQAALKCHSWLLSLSGRCWAAIRPK